MRTDAAPPGNHARAILLRLLAVVAFACMAAAIKLAVAHGASVVETIFYRNLFSLPLVLGWIMLGPGLSAIRVRRPGAHVSRTAIGLVSMLFNFQALAMLPLAEATVISFSAPFFATALSALLLAEPVGRHRWLAVLAGLLGVVLVMQPSGDNFPLAGAAVGVAAALGVASVNVTLRQIAGTETPTAIVFWFMVGSTIIVGIGLPWFARAHDATTWGLLVLIGVLGGAAQFLNTASLRLAPVSALSPFDYTQLLWVTLLGWLIWDMRPAPETWAGAAVIVASGLYIFRRERVLRRVSVPVLASDGSSVPIFPPRPPTDSSPR